MTRPAQAVVAALGFIADLGAMQTWGLETLKRHVVVDSAMRTNLPRVFAAGDITEYPGKVRLIAVGFGEAATAVNNAAVAIDPTRARLPRALERGHLVRQQQADRLVHALQHVPGRRTGRSPTRPATRARRPRAPARRPGAPRRRVGRSRRHRPGEHRGQQHASTRRISSATEASANMNARVIASVRCGSRCSAAGVPGEHVHHPVVRRCRRRPALPRSRASASLELWRRGRDTSRWILEGK